MPYITNEEKPQYEDALRELEATLKGKPQGHLTFVLFVLAKRWLGGTERVCYDTISNMLAATHDSEQELRRRILNPYEDLKIAQNGDAE